MTGGLNGVGVHGHAARVSDADDVFDRLDRADLVVGVHDTDQGGLFGNRAFELIQVDRAELVDLDFGQLEAGVGGQPAACVEDGMMLNAAGDQLASTRRRGRQCHAFDRQVRALAAGPGEDDLLAGAAKDVGEGVTGADNSLGGATAGTVQA